MTSASPRCHVDSSQVTQQGRMEKLVDMLSTRDKAIFQDSQGNFLPIARWRGLRFDEEGNIISICWNDFFHEQGMLHFIWIPPTVLIFGASNCSLIGFLLFSDLPRQLQVLQLSGNYLSGNLRMSDLPASIEYLSLSKNAFSGTIDMSNTSCDPFHVDFSGNHLEGPLNIPTYGSYLKTTLNFDDNLFRQDICIADMKSRAMLSLKGNLINEDQIKANCGRPDAEIVDFVDRYLVDRDENRLVWVSSKRVTVPRQTTHQTEDHVGTLPTKDRQGPPTENASEIYRPERYVLDENLTWVSSQQVTNQVRVLYDPARTEVRQGPPTGNVAVVSTPSVGPHSNQAAQQSNMQQLQRILRGNESGPVAKRSIEEIELECMIKVISPLSDKSKARFKDKNGEYLPLRRWHGVILSCGYVRDIVWYQMFKGDVMLDLSALPSQIEKFKAGMCGFVGPLSLKGLPHRLRILDLKHNSLSGHLDLTGLPASLYSLLLADNQFSGPLDLSGLPKFMGHLNLSHNRLRSPLNLRSTPEKEFTLNLRNNLFTNEVYIGRTDYLTRRIILSDNPIDLEAIKINCGDPGATVRKSTSICYNETFDLVGSNGFLAFLGDKRTWERVNGRVPEFHD